MNNCPDEKVLSSYLDKRLSESEKACIEEHIAGCNNCLELLLTAYEADKKGFCSCPPKITQDLSRKLGFNTGRKRKHFEIFWFLSSVAFFLLSFVVKRYFLQFLGAGFILGFKWVMDGEGAKRIIMIFKGIKDEEISHIVNKKL